MDEYGWRLADCANGFAISETKVSTPLEVSDRASSWIVLVGTSMAAGRVGNGMLR